MSDCRVPMPTYERPTDPRLEEPEPIRGVVRWSEGIDTEIAYSRTLEDGTERHVEGIELDGERYERVSDG